MTRRNVLWIVALLPLLVFLAACGGDTSSSDGGDQNGAGETAQVSLGDPAAGETKYNEVCIACHGAAGAGIENLGKPFTTSEFIRDNNDDALLAFVKTGRPIGDPANTTGVDMPPKGGNPALTDDQILDIIAYIRTLQE